MKINKVIMILLILFLVSIVVCTPLFSATISTSDVQNNKNIGNAETQIKTVGQKIFSAIHTVGVVISVIIIAVLGIKYMMGSADQRAEYKKSMMPYLVGAALVFSATSIANIIYKIAK